MTILASLLSSALGLSKPSSPQDQTSPVATATATATAVPAVPTVPTPARAATLPASPAPDTSSVPPADRSVFSQRAMKQLGLFCAGATMFALSTTITRRAIVRKQLAAQLKFYEPSGTTGATRAAAAEAAAKAAARAAEARPGVKATGPAAEDHNPHGSLDALEALNLATLNVVGFLAMLTGGVMWGFDLSSLDDVRQLARRFAGTQRRGGGERDEESEREVEEWVASVLQRLDTKTKGGNSSSSSSSQPATDGEKPNKE